MMLSFIVSAVVFGLIHLISNFFSYRRFKKTEKHFQVEVDKSNLYKKMIINRNNFILLNSMGLFEKNPELKKFVEKNNKILEMVGLEFDLNCLIRQTAKNEEEEEKRFKRLKKEIINCPEEVRELVVEYNSAFKELIRIRFPWLHRKMVMKLYYNRVIIKYIIIPLIKILEKIVEHEGKCVKNEESKKYNDIKYGIKIFNFSQKIDSSLQRVSV